MVFFSKDVKNELKSVPDGMRPIWLGDDEMRFYAKLAAQRSEWLRQKQARHVVNRFSDPIIDAELQNAAAAQLAARQALVYGALEPSPAPSLAPTTTVPTVR